MTKTKIFFLGLIASFILFDASAQCNFPVNSGGFNYDLSVSLSINNVIYTQAGTTCNVQIEVAYDVEIDTNGAQPSWWNAEMYTLQGNFNCLGGSGSSFFNLPNGGGQGTVTSATFSFSSTDCSNVVLNCPITLQISGPQLNYNGACGNLSIVALPVNLEQFSYKNIGANEIEAFWTTSSEEQLSHFELEESTDAKTWKALARVDALNIPSGSAYAHTYTRAPYNQYLRMKMIDIDGKISFSEVLNIPTAQGASIQLWPNPANNSLHMNGINSKDLAIINSFGQKMSFQILNEQLIDISNLSPGIYAVYNKNAAGIKESVRFIKQSN